MPTVTYSCTVTTPGGETAPHYIWADVGDNAHPVDFGVNNLHLHNTSTTTSQSVTMYHYYADGTFGGTIGSAGIPPLGTHVESWDGTLPDWQQVAINAITPPPGAWTLEVSWDGPTTTLCAYGTEKKSSTDTVVDIGMGLIDVLGIAAGAPWAVGAIIASAGSKLYIDHLCTTLPPGDADIVDSDWSTPTSNPFVSVGTQKIVDKFNATAWNYFCQCKPATGGGPPPVGPVTVNWNIPISIVNVSAPHASEVFITNQINNLTYVLGGMQTTINNLTTIVTNLHDCSCLDSYVLGATYTGLVDTGTLIVSDLVGVLVEVVEWPASNSVLVGNPGYLWNMGWMSIDNLNGMLEEKRITREQFVWLPAHMSLATSFRWFAYPGVTLRMTELRAN